MPDAYITLWNQQQVEYERHRGLGAGVRLDHSANRQFRRSGVKRGDRVYVVATRAGALLLLARIEVERVLGQREAERHFGYEVYRAPDHLIGRGTELDLDRVVPEHVARAIRRESGKPIKIAADSYHVDANSLRTTGRISEDSAALLDALLDAGPLRIDVDGGRTFTEGSRHEQRRRVIERSALVRGRALAIHGTTCCVCAFSFADTYGELGAGFAEVHHLAPLRTARGAITVNPATDVVVLCANCHRMVHREDPPLTPAALRKRLSAPVGR